MPLYLLDGRNTLLQASTFRAQFPACPSTPLPAKFTHGKKATVCLVYFAPDHGTLDRGQLPPDARTFDADHLDRPGHRRSRRRRSTPTQQSSPSSLAARTRAADNRRMSPLTLGSLTVPTPVVLAPMAGITNAAYRRLCAEQGAGLYVCEMITSPRAGRARLARR